MRGLRCNHNPPQHLVIDCYVNRKIKNHINFIGRFAQKSVKKFVKNIRTFFQVFLAFLQQLCYYAKARCENAA